MDEKLNQKINNLQNDLTILKLRVNEIIKLMKEIKEWQTQHSEK